jgi:hypothetical protein
VFRLMEGKTRILNTYPTLEEANEDLGLLEGSASPRLFVEPHNPYLWQIRDGLDRILTSYHASHDEAVEAAAGRAIRLSLLLRQPVLIQRKVGDTIRVSAFPV